MYKYTAMLKQTQRHTGPGGGTRRLHQKEIIMNRLIRGVYDEEPLSIESEQISV